MTITFTVINFRFVSQLSVFQKKTIAECVALGVKCATMMIRQSGCSLPDRKSYENVFGY